VSGPKCGEYTVRESSFARWASEREQARREAEAAQRERERLALAREMWTAAQRQRAALQARAVNLASLYEGLRPPAIPALDECPSWAADAVAAALATAEAASTELAGRLDRLAVEGRTVMARSLARGLGVEGGGVVRVTGDQSPAAVGKAGTEAAEAARIAARLDPEAGTPREISRLLDEIAAGPVARRRVLVRQLRADVTAVNRSLETRREARRAQAAALRRLHETAEQLDDAPLRLQVASAKTEHATGQIVDVAPIERAAEAAAQRHRQRLAELRRTYVQETVTAAFAELGYEVLAGVDVSVPSDGVLVRREASSPHAVRVTVDRESIDIEPVRLVAEGQGAAVRTETERAEDVRAEEALCADALDESSPLWRAIARAGVDVHVESIRPGVVVPPSVEVPATLLRAGRIDPTTAVERARDLP
jgi:hypothetical protein